MKRIFTVLSIFFIFNSCAIAATNPSFFNIKNKPCVSLEDFGGIGDGITDCSSAFNSAIATKSAILLGSGTYYCASPIYLASGTTIFGTGKNFSTIKGASGTPVFELATTTSECSNVVMKDFKVLGGSIGIKNTSGHMMERFFCDDVQFESQTSAGIYFSGSNSWMLVSNLTNVSFYYCTSGLVLNSGESNLVNVDKCRFEGLSGSGIVLKSASPGSNLCGSGVSIDKCRFEAIVGTPISVDNGYINLRIENCYFEDAGSPNIVLAHTGAIGRNLNISNNHFSGNMRTSPNISISLGAGFSGPVIMNNYCGSINIDSTGGSGLVYLSNFIHTGSLSVTGGVSCFSVNDAGKTQETPIYLGNGYDISLTNGVIRFINNTNAIEVKSTPGGGFSICPNSASGSLSIDTAGQIHSETPGGGIIVKSPDGNNWRLFVTNSGIASVTSIP